MSIDHRTRMERDVRDLERDEILEAELPAAIAQYGDLAARGVMYKALPTLGLIVDGAAMSVRARTGSIDLRPGVEDAGVIAELDAAALSDLVQDRQSTMGLAMTSRVQITAGSLNDWIAWEPALRALLDGRRVHESGDVGFDDGAGGELDLDRTFTIDDDHAEIGHFLGEAGFLHLRNVFTEAEMAAVQADLDYWLAQAAPDDGASWWARDAAGIDQAVRVLWFNEKSDALAALLADDRLTWLAEITGDGHAVPTKAEGLVKPLNIVNGLSDLPWHKDCGQGLHSYFCNSMTVGISVTGADRSSGALGVIPGSHRANTIATMRDRDLDLPSRQLETVTGDVTVHCSDTLHRAYPPTERPRHVVYAGFRLPPIAGDEVQGNPRYSREARAELTTVRDRIEAAENPAASNRFRAGDE